MGKKKRRKEAEQAQLALVPPSVHTSEASVEAAEKIEPFTGNLREHVYDCIAMFGPMTDEAIAVGLNMNPSTQRPRRLELQRAGRIVQVGHGRTRAGHKAALWATA